MRLCLLISAAGCGSISEVKDAGRENAPADAVVEQTGEQTGSTDTQVQDAAVESPSVIDAGACTLPADCDDGNPCTLDQCLTGVCSRTNWPTGTTCEDDVFCNGTDICRSGACVHSQDACPPGTLSCSEDREWCLCNDNNDCTTNDRFITNVCKGDPADNQACGTGPTGEPKICCGSSCVFANQNPNCGSCGTQCNGSQSCSYCGTGPRCCP